MFVPSWIFSDPQQLLSSWIFFSHRIPTMSKMMKKHALVAGEKPVSLPVISLKPHHARRGEGYHQGPNGRREVRYRFKSRFELKLDKLTTPAYKGFRVGLYKYEFLE